MVAVAIVVFVVGCADPAARKIPVVSVSIEPQRWLLEQIVGDKMEVRSLMGNGGNPEHYEPTFSHLANLEKVWLIFRSVIWASSRQLWRKYRPIIRICQYIVCRIQYV